MISYSQLQTKYNLDLKQKNKSYKNRGTMSTNTNKDKSQQEQPHDSLAKDVFTTFQTVVHLSEDLQSNHVFVVMGASGDLAKKKIYPTLWWLYRSSLLPDKTYFLGFARTKLDISEFLTKNCLPYMKVKEAERVKFEEFVARNYYLSGTYDKPESFAELSNKVLEVSKLNSAGASSSSSSMDDCNRIFYLALPPSVYTSVTRLLSQNCKAKRPHFTRVVSCNFFGL